MLLEKGSSKLPLNLNNESVLYLATVAVQKNKIYNLEDESTISSQLVQTLLENEADPNQHSKDYISLLSALKAKDVQTSALLLEASANINVTNCRGKSGLHIVFEHNRETGLYKKKV